MSRSQTPWPAFLPIPALAVLIVVLDLIVDPSVLYDPPWLILIGNTLFVTVALLVVSFIAMRNYLVTGRFQVLLLGCGVLAFGAGAVAAAAVRGLPGGANLNVIIYNGAALLGALFHFAAAFLLVSGFSAETIPARRRPLLALGCACPLALVALLSTAALAGWIPPFHIHGALGFTPIRQLVLGCAIALFLFSFFVFIGLYLRNRDPFLFWYSCALALTALSLAAFFIQASVGSPVGWAGRCSQYLGGAYFLVSLVTAGRGAQTRHTSLDEVLSASLAGSEEKFRVLAENLPDAVRRFDRDLIHLYVNPACARLYGRPAARIIGKTVDQVGLSAERAAMWRSRLQDVFRGREPSVAEEEIASDGGVRFFRSLCVPEFNPEGAVANVLVVSHDLTDRRRMEVELREREERFRLFFTGMQESFVVLEVVRDPAGAIADLRYVEANPVAERQLGRTREQLIGRLRSEVQGPLGEAERRLIEGTLSIDRPVHLERFDEATGLWYQVIMYSPQPGQVATLKLDITERKLIEKELVHLNESLERRVAERTAESVRLATQLRALASELSQAEQRERTRLSSILHDHIQQLLVAARYKLEGVRLQEDDRQAGSLVSSAKELLMETLEATRNLTIEISPPILKQSGLIAALRWLVERMKANNQFVVELEADEAAEPCHDDLRLLLFECSRELLFNSFKHSGVRQAKLSVRRDGDSRIAIVVEDRGSGFDPLQAGGTGGAPAFGLFSIEQRLAHRGGEFRIDSAPGKGTRVRMSVPLSERTPANP